MKRLNPVMLNVFAKDDQPWATFYTTASSPNPVQITTRMPTGEKLYIDPGDGSGVIEVIGTSVNQVTDLLYDPPVVGTEITITDDGGNRFLMAYFGINQQHLSGDHPPIAGFSDLTTIYLRENEITSVIPPYTGCTSLVNIFNRLTPFTGQPPVIAGLSSLTSVYWDRCSFSGNIPSLTGIPNLGVCYFYGNNLTGFSGGFTPLADRTNSINFQVQNNILPAAEINKILADARTAEFGTGDSLRMDGTNEAPTGQGLIDKTWLQDNGCTVTTS